MRSSWLKARTLALVSRSFLGCAFTGTESSEMADATEDRVFGRLVAGFRYPATRPGGGDLTRLSRPGVARGSGLFYFRVPSCNNPGSFAILAAMRRALPRMNSRLPLNCEKSLRGAGCRGSTMSDGCSCSRCSSPRVRCRPRAQLP